MSFPVETQCIPIDPDTGAGWRERWRSLNCGARKSRNLLNMGVGSVTKVIGMVYKGTRSGTKIEKRGEMEVIRGN